MGPPVCHCVAGRRSLHHGGEQRGSLPVVMETRHQSGPRHGGSDWAGFGQIRSLNERHCSTLSRPATKITLSNVPPFISDDFPCTELSRHGKIVSPIEKVFCGCRFLLLKHVVSHRRQVYMILNNRGEELEVRLRVRVDRFDYVLFISSVVFRLQGGGTHHKNVSAPGRCHR